MTSGLYVTGTHVAWVEHGPPPDGRGLRRAGTVAHAVARPVVDGLGASVCGVLVTAIADMDWHDVGPSPGVRSASGSRSGPDPDDRVGHRGRAYR
jgi:hypothetical protein